jgi:hypothetical protein
MVVDPATEHLALMAEQSHAAVGVPSPGFCGDTTAQLWRWNGHAWSGPSTDQGVPTGSLSLGTDPATHEVVALTAKGQTWTWDGHTWTQRHPAHAPGPRVRAALTFDPARQQLLLFGGSEELEGDPAVPMGDTWTWDGSDWTHVATAAPTRSG